MGTSTSSDRGARVGGDEQESAGGSGGPGHTETQLCHVVRVVLVVVDDEEACGGFVM